MSLPLSMDIHLSGFSRRLQVDQDLVQLAQIRQNRSFSNDVFQEAKRKLREGYVVVITDKEQSIVWVSSHFRFMTGYSPRDVIGKKPRMFQGKKTDPSALLLIRSSLQAHQSVDVDLLNYRRDGSSYICSISIKPLSNQVLTQHSGYIAFEKSNIAF